VIDFQRGAAQHGFTTALAQAGLTPEDAHFVDVESPSYDQQDGPRAAPSERRNATLDALENGEIDALFIRYARGYRVAQDSRFRQLLNIFDLTDPLQRVNNGTPRPITVDRAFLDKHPEVVARYLAVLLRTAKWAENHRNEVAELLLPESGGETLDDVFAAHGDDVHLSFTPKLTQDYIDGLETQKNFLRDWGYLKQDFDVKDWVVHEPLAQAYKLIDAERTTEAAA
jgi:ABC-type nitrate/sulfonate/bicarbonate transport system substrate-binding protein